jgi:hypothetical protein
MEKVESIVADLEEVYQRVVPKSKENGEYKVECRKSSTPAAKFGHHLGTGTYGDDQAIRHVAEDIDDNYQKMDASG